MTKLVFALAFISVALAQGAKASIPEASLLDEGYRSMYNLQFQQAHKVFHEYETANPRDPMGPVSDAAAYLFSEFDRLNILQSEFFVQNDSFFHMQHLNPDANVKKQFEAALGKAQQLADQILAKSPNDANARFVTCMRLGLHADYLALVEKRYLASLGEMKQGRAIAEDLVAKHPDMYDAYLAVGVENYLLSIKPAPVRWLLRAGGAETDKQVGIEKLRVTAEKGHYLLPYARLLLAVAALRDKDQQHAKQLLSWLAGQYPQNRLYHEELAKLR